MVTSSLPCLLFSTTICHRHQSRLDSDAESRIRFFTLSRGALERVGVVEGRGLRIQLRSYEIRVMGYFFSFLVNGSVRPSCMRIEQRKWRLSICEGRSAERSYGRGCSCEKTVQFQKRHSSTFSCPRHRLPVSRFQSVVLRYRRFMGEPVG